MRRTWSSTSTPSCGSPRRCCRCCARSAPSAIVNVASTAGRVARAGSGAYSASKFALAGWTDALYLEERAATASTSASCSGLHRHRGLPAARAARRRATRWLVSKPERVAKAIVEAGPGGKAERYVPRAYGAGRGARILTPRLVRRVLGGGAAQDLTTRTAGEAP